MDLQKEYRVPFSAFLLQYLSSHHLIKWMPDKTYVKLIYRFNTGRKLNLKNPQRYTEKLQWIKLYDRRPEYTTYVDKYAVREFVKTRVGEEYLIPLLGVWNSPDEVDFDTLPDQFVLKCNHDSGGYIICKDKEKLDKAKAIKFLNKKFKVNFYWAAREWPYKNVKRKIIAEKYMVDESGTELKDYKFFCFDGVCRAIYVASNRGVDTRFDFFDRDFVHLPVTCGHPNANTPPDRPQGLDKMILLAEELSKGIPQVRVDLYNIFGKIYFGEMTMFHFGGKRPFKPDEWDYTFGSWIHLENN